ncbi:uncharacterized protein METZ01_LOCUS125622 [marine metagenome]|uniref:Uncharacterized protein n=1 Tax=marine metagenome TaxID=408172 RepID=A0A381Y6T9_9ZZZZ
MSNLTKKNRPIKLGKPIKFTALTGLILGITFIGILSANIDSFRDPIMSELSQITGLPIEIKSLNLSLSKGLSLHGTGLNVRSKDNSQQIFSAQDIFLNVKLKPILKGEFKIKKVILINPIMDIALNPRLNPIDLPKIHENLETPDQKMQAQSNDLENVKSMPITTTPTNLTESLRNLFQSKNFSLRTIEVKDAQLTITRPKFDLLPETKVPIFLSAKFDLDNPLPEKVNIIGDIFDLDVQGLSFRGNTKVTDLLAKKNPINLNLESSSIPAKKINTLVELLSDTGPTPLKFKSGQIEKFFISLKGFIASSDNPFNEVFIETRFKAEGLEVSTSRVPQLESIPLVNIEGNGVWENNTLNYMVRGILWDGNITSNLIANLPDLFKGTLAGTYNITTKFNELDLPLIRVNLFDKWTPATGTINGSIITRSSLNKDIRVSSELKINDLSFENEVPYTSKHVTLAFSKKSDRHALAGIRFTDLQLNNVFINTLSSKIKITPEIFSFSNGHISPSNGTILFSGQYRPKSKTFAIRFNGNKLLLSDFSEQQIKGSGSLNGMFQGNTNKAEIIKKKGEAVRFSHIANGISGKFGFAFKKGNLNTPIWVIDQLAPSLKPASTVISKKIGLEYETLIGGFKVWEGKVTTDNFELKGPQINLAASANANLVNGKIDGEIKVTPMQLFNKITKASPLLGDIFKEDLKDILNQTHFSLDGTLGEPKLTQKLDKKIPPKL